MSGDAREVLARLIYCEASGEGETGMKAVGSVIMNRVQVPCGEYLRIGQGDLRKIAYQANAQTGIGEFHVCAIQQQMWYLTPSQEAYAAADYVLSGNRISDLGRGSLWYHNPKKSVVYADYCKTFWPGSSGIICTRIGDHCFYKYTRAYCKT
ncbi:cell wall hydrolase [Clostridium botulinum]|nr:cell wall hydrolase [Clostridium botulinum]